VHVAIALVTYNALVRLAPVGVVAIRQKHRRASELATPGWSVERRWLLDPESARATYWPATQPIAWTRSASGKTLTSPGVIQPNRCVRWTIQSMSVTTAIRFQSRR
jgi:hypothetical protein